jgi:hypothetical protein
VKSSSVFFGKKFDVSSSYRTGDIFVEYTLASIASQRNGVNTADALSLFEKEFPGQGVNRSNFDYFLDSHFAEAKDIYSVSKNQASAISKIPQFKSDLFVGEWDDDQTLLKNIGKAIGEKRFDPCSVLPSIFAFDYKRTKRESSYYESLFYWVVSRYDDLASKADFSVNAIDESYDEMSISLLVANPAVTELMFASGVSTLLDLKQLSPDSLVALFAIDFDPIVSTLNGLGGDFTSFYKEKVKALVSVLSPDELRIIKERNGYFGGQEKTLEEIGSEFGVTRERIRQMESRAIKKIKSGYHSAKNVLVSVYNLLSQTNKNYVEQRALRDFVKDDEITWFILFIFQYCSDTVFFDSKLGIIYNSAVCSEGDIVDGVIDVFGKCIRKGDYAALSEYEQRIVERHYHLFRDSVYILNGESGRLLSDAVVKDSFPDGFQTGSDEDYEKFCTAFRNAYGQEVEIPSKRAVYSNVTRSLDFCQTGRGIYKRRDYCSSIDQELLDQIINYIIANQPTVFYASIFEHFKEKLVFSGIDNYFYLKGLIDPSLPKDFKTKRNYITLRSATTSYEALVIYAKTFNGTFTLDDLRDKFEGVKDYTFYNMLYNESENGLIFLSYTSFVYIDKVVITKDTIDEFKKYITGMFAALDTKVVGARKLFGRLSLTNSDLLKRLKICDDQFSFFSLAKYLFKDSFYFRRPLIAIEQEACSGVYEKYVEKLDTFNIDTIRSFSSKMGLRGLYSYSDFMDEMSDSFVQINIDTMIKKERLGLSEKTLGEIDEMLNLIFTKYDSIDTKSFSGYQMFPDVKYHWNKYLLSGILKSYFGGKYEVDNTDSVYDKTDFIIRRISK